MECSSYIHHTDEIIYILFLLILILGLLGTNNREAYDDTKLPNGEIAKSIFKFINAYETSGDKKCKLQETNKQTPCQKIPSLKCEERFRSESSPFASHFNSVDPEPFFRACELDTSDCRNKENKKVNYCGIAGFYWLVWLVVGWFWL